MYVDAFATRSIYLWGDNVLSFLFFFPSHDYLSIYLGELAGWKEGWFYHEEYGQIYFKDKDCKVEERDWRSPLPPLDFSWRAGDSWLSFA